MDEQSFESLALEEQFKRQCAGKDKYPSEAAALAAIKMFKEDGVLNRQHQLKPYACKFCPPNWHFGH